MFEHILTAKNKSIHRATKSNITRYKIFNGFNTYIYYYYSLALISQNNHGGI